MSKFKLKEKALTIRDMEVRVRELTHGERGKFAAEASKDSYRGPSLIAAMGAVEPKQTEEEWAGEPADVVQAVVDAILELSGMKSKEGAPQKEPDAG